MCRTLEPHDREHGAGEESKYRVENLWRALNFLQDSPLAKVVDSSTDLKDEDIFPAGKRWRSGLMIYLRIYAIYLEYIDGDEFCGSCRVAFCLDGDHDISQEPIEGPGRYIVRWHR